MIRISLLYPNRTGAWFDMNYYLNQHLPLAMAMLGDVLKGVWVDEGLSAGSQGQEPPFLAVCHFLAESRQAYQQALAPHRELLARDIARYTNLEPLIQYSRVRTPRVDPGGVAGDQKPPAR